MFFAGCLSVFFFVVAMTRNNPKRIVLNEFVLVVVSVPVVVVV